jgi:hypothetical protein
VPQDGDLYIRHSATDHGERDLAAGTVFWTSPAIRVLGSGLGDGAAVADQDQTVRVLVGNRNLTNAFTDVEVQVYAAEWGAANPWLFSLGGTQGVPIGPQTVVAHARHDINNEGVFEVSWRPDSSELGGADHKHICLLANVWAGSEGAEQSAGVIFNDILTNQHHAQRNITLNAAAPGNAMAFGFNAGNPGEEGAAFVLEIVELTDRRLNPIEAFHLAGAEWLVEAQEKLEKPLELLPPLGDVRIEAGDQSGSRVKLKLEAGEQIPVTLHGSKGESRRPGLRRFMVVQRFAGSDDVVGGAELLTAVVPPELIPKPLRGDLDRAS